MGDFRLRIKHKLTDVFGCDPRSLAVFRIGIAVLILLDLIDRARDLRAHYSDWGVLPRGAVVDLFLHPSCFSLYFINGTWYWQLFLFLLAGLFALALLVGYRTRFMTVASWLLLVSLQNRNPLVLQGGDVLIRMILFWAMFLPLGACCSLDHRFARASRTTQDVTPPSILTWATAALVTQAVFLYVFAALLKTGPEWTENYTAVYYAMSIDQLTTPLGHWLLGHRDLMRASTYLTVKIELFGPLLFFIPFYTGFFRIAAIVLLFVMQMGFGATMRVYIFPWVCFCATLPMVPSVFWDKLPNSVKAWSGRTLRSTERTFTWAFVWLKGRVPPQFPVVVTPRWVNLTAAFFLAYVALWNLGTLPVSIVEKRVDVPRRLQWIGLALRVDQQWNMFAPNPLRDDGWYVIPGTLVDGTVVDVFRRGMPLTWEKPRLVAYTYKNQRWQKYMMNLWSRDFSMFREFYGKYLCRSWNDVRKGAEQLDHFTIYFMREDTLPDGEAVPEKISLWEHYCFKVPEKKEP